MFKLKLPCEIPRLVLVVKCHFENLFIGLSENSLKLPKNGIGWIKKYTIGIVTAETL